jgi:hypothetical protein
MSKSFTATRLLILTGSDEVASINGRRPAIDHFDGAAFRMVRQHLAECPAIVADGLHVLVLTSAGLLGAYETVSDWISGIDDTQTAELQGSKSDLRNLHTALDDADSVFILCSEEIETALGCMMMSRVGGSADWMRSQVARGSDARKLNGLLRWLVRTTPTVEGRADMNREAATAVECATDGRLSAKAQAMVDSLMADLEACRFEISARRSLSAAE